MCEAVDSDHSHIKVSGLKVNKNIDTYRTGHFRLNRVLN